MPGQLIPLDLGFVTDTPPDAPPKNLFAILTRDRVEQLARAMPDGQSAILICLLWQASLHERMRRGPFAGQPVASMSGPRLATMTGRPLRSIRYALGRLRATGLLIKDATSAGCKNVYRFPFLRPNRAIANLDAEVM